MVRKVLAYPLFFLALVLLFVSLNLFAFFSVLNDGETAKDLVEKSGIYEEAGNIAVDFFLVSLYREANESGREVREIFPLGQFLTEEELKERVSEVFPPAWIQGQTEENIDRFYSYLRGDERDFELDIDFEGREGYMQAAIADVFKGHFDSLPPCEDGQEISLEEYELFAQDCIPGNIDKGVIFSYIDNEVSRLKFAQAAGGQVSIGASQVLGSVAGGYMLFRFISYLGLFLSLFLVALLYFVIVKERAKHRFLLATYSGVLILNLAWVLVVRMRAREWLERAFGVRFAGSADLVEKLFPLFLDLLWQYFYELGFLSLFVGFAAFTHYLFVRSKDMGYSVYLRRAYLLLGTISVVGFFYGLSIFGFLEVGIK